MPDIKVTLQDVLMITLLFLVVHVLNAGVNAVNIGDYERILFPFINADVFQTFTPMDFRSVAFKESFSPIRSIEYPSTYTYFLYVAFSIASLFSENLSLDLLFMLKELLFAIS